MNATILIYLDGNSANNRWFARNEHHRIVSGQHNRPRRDSQQSFAMTAFETMLSIIGFRRCRCAQPTANGCNLFEVVVAFTEKCRF